MDEQKNVVVDEQRNICPDSNLVWAILCTVLCCLPLGIVAIIKSTSVESLWREGRYEEAKKAANDAKKFSIWGAIAAGVFIVLYIIFIIFMAVFSVGIAEMM